MRVFLALAIGLALLVQPGDAQARDDGSDENGDEDDFVVGRNGSSLLTKQADLTLERIKKSYDSLISPQNAESPPTPTVLKVGVSIVAMNGVDVVAGTLSMTIFTQVRVSFEKRRCPPQNRPTHTHSLKHEHRLQYRDERLKFSRKEAGIIEIGQGEREGLWLWDPKMVVSWSLSSTAIIPPMTVFVANEILYKDGLNVRQYSNVAVQLSQEFNVKWYPFDRQTFILKMGSEHHLGEVSTTFSKRYWGGPIWTDRSPESGDLKCRGTSSDCVRYLKKKKKYGLGKEDDAFCERIYFYLDVGRNSNSYLLVWFVPLQLIIMISCSTFWQDPVGSGGRDGIVLTAFLAMIFYQMEIRQVIPKVPCKYST
jgi:hypothetical protein